MLNAPQSVIFDFDYTLADSSDGVIVCVNHALAGLSLPPEPPERIRHTIGLSLAATLVELKGTDKAHLSEAFEGLFIACADDVMVERTVLYSWVPDVAASLAALGIALGIVSTKFRRRIQAVLEREGLATRFAAIVGGNDVVSPKPAPDGLAVALRILHTPPERALYVGDSPADGKAARSAGVRFVAVRSGVTPLKALASLSPVAILNDASELPTLIGAH
jgi:phosphoglycolate phosphatase